MFSDRFEELCARKGVKPGRACSEMGVSRSLAAKWKATQTERPSAEVLEKMADYFCLSIDEILGKTEKSTEVDLRLDNVYLSFAREAQEKGISPEDIKLAIDTIERLRNSR